MSSILDRLHPQLNALYNTQYKLRHLLPSFEGTGRQTVDESETSFPLEWVSG